MSQEVVVNKCDRCSKIYATKYTLAVHQKTSKSCISSNNNEKKTYDCDYCKKSFSSTQSVKYHLEICVEKKEEEKCNEIENLKKELEKKAEENENKIENLKKEFETTNKEKNNEIQNLKKELENRDKIIISKDLIITKLETKLEQLQDKDKQLQDKDKQIQDKDKQQDKQLEVIKDLAKTAIEKKTTTTVKNTTVNNVGGDLTVYFNQDVINQKIHTRLTENDLYTGYKGIAEFLKLNIATDDNGKLIYFCVDPARQYFCYKDDQGNEIKDLKAQKMITLIKTAMQERIAVIYEEQCRKQTRLLEEKADINGREMQMCEFAIQKTGKMKFDIYEITDNNKMASEMAKILYKYNNLKKFCNDLGRYKITNKLKN